MLVCPFVCMSVCVFVGHWYQKFGLSHALHSACNQMEPCAIDQHSQTSHYELLQQILVKFQYKSSNTGWPLTQTAWKWSSWTRLTPTEEVEIVIRGRPRPIAEWNAGQTYSEDLPKFGAHNTSLRTILTGKKKWATYQLESKTSDNEDKWTCNC